jgi:hypothetical protein
VSWIKTAWAGIAVLGVAGALVAVAAPQAPVARAAAPSTVPASTPRRFEIFKTIASCQVRRELVDSASGPHEDALALDAQAACEDGANRLADLGAPDRCSLELQVRGVAFLHISDAVERGQPGARRDAEVAFDHADALDHECTDALNAEA